MVARLWSRTKLGGALWMFGLAWLAVSGCQREDSAQGGSGSPSKQTGLYGEIATVPSTNFTPARPMSKAAMAWTKAPFAVLQSELSPAVLLHSDSSYLGLFTDMEASGLGGPSHVGFSAMAGPRSYKKGESLPVMGMEENWLIVWFAGSTGWTNWDSAWAVFLQRKPLGMILDDSGLHIQFTQAAGDVVMMPIFGYEKLPPEGTNILVRTRGPAQKTKSWEWSDFLPRNLLMRVRYWASATREFPIYCHDTFQVDRSRDEVVLRQSFEWYPIRDDWKTRPVKLAPVSPPLALAMQEKDNPFPARLSADYLDYEYFTPYGPYLGVEGVDEYEVTFPVLRYVHELEASDPIGTNGTQIAQTALDRMRVATATAFQNAEIQNGQYGAARQASNLGQAVAGDSWYAKGLPYYDESTRSKALDRLRRYFRDDVLQTNRFERREIPQGSGQTYYVLMGADGELNAKLLESIWAYAHYSGDWELVRERWPLIKGLFVGPGQTRWVGFGRDNADQLNEEAVPSLALARLAYHVGDIDTYHYACAMFARGLTHLYVKQRGAEYFRKHQPWHSMEAMEGDVYLTHLRDDTAGWQIDGLNYQKASNEHPFHNRWVGFSDLSVARFFRETLGPYVNWEMKHLTEREEGQRGPDHDPRPMSSLVPWRSLLLNESPEKLAQWAPDPMTGPSWSIIANALAMIRTSHPPRYERLIPAASASPFVTGVEREVPGPHPHLLVNILIGESDGDAPEDSWPVLSWWESWKTPTGQRWNFGRVQPDREPPTGKVKTIPLNWNTRVMVWGE